jgi:hypothetical protein
VIEERGGELPRQVQGGVQGAGDVEEVGEPRPPGLRRGPAHRRRPAPPQVALPAGAHHRLLVLVGFLPNNAELRLMLFLQYAFRVLA